jgi:hypothetical protein
MAAQDGMSAPQIARALGISTSLARLVLRDYGLGR